jgi:hypothetical protein
MAWLGGKDIEEDSAFVSISFQNSKNQHVGGMDVLGPVTATDRKDKTAFLSRNISAQVPVGSRMALISAVIIRATGNRNQGYIDSITFRLFV